MEDAINGNKEADDEVDCIMEMSLKCQIPSIDQTCCVDTVLLS